MQRKLGAPGSLNGAWLRNDGWTSSLFALPFVALTTENYRAANAQGGGRDDQGHDGIIGVSLVGKAHAQTCAGSASPISRGS